MRNGYSIPISYAAAPGRGPQRLGLALAIVLHIAVLAALLAWEPAHSALTAMVPIMVSLIAPPAPEPAKHQPRPVQAPKPLPLRSREPPPPLPLLATSAQTPAPRAVPAEPEPATAAPAIAAAPALSAPPQPVTPPRFDAAYLDNPAPVYPRLARRMGEQGKVVLRVLVSAAGLAERIELRASSGSVRLDQAARETVTRWRFVPARQGAEAVSAWVLVPISFTLEG